MKKLAAKSSKNDLERRKFHSHGKGMIEGGYDRRMLLKQEEEATGTHTKIPTETMQRSYGAKGFERNRRKVAGACPKANAHVKNDT